MVPLTVCFDEESLVDEKTQELKAKDETMSLKEKLIQEKSDNIVSLEKELTLLQVCVNCKICICVLMGGVIYSSDRYCFAHTCFFFFFC